MRILIILAFLLAPVTAPALDADEMFNDPAMEARARAIGRQLRCLKCRNQSIFDSNAGIAKDLRIVVRERMVSGDTDTEILDFIHARYGDYVLLNPKVSGQTLILWGAPAGLLLLSVGVTTAYLRRRTRAEVADDLTEADRAEARALLETVEKAR